MRHAVVGTVAIMLIAGSAYGQSTCTAAKYKVAGKLSLGLAKCRSTAAKHGVPVDPLCVERAAAKFGVKWARAESKGDCPLGDGDTTETLIESCITDLAALLQPPPTTTSTSTTSTTSTSLGTCSFSGAACTSDADCDIPGVCWNGTGTAFVCHHKCTTSADCTPQTFCYLNGEIGLICVGCGQAGSEDDTKCTAEEVCDLNDCKQFNHLECTTSGLPCTISDPCLP